MSAPNGIRWDDSFVTLKWGGYDYNILLSRIDTPEKALGWLAHICEKSWAGTTSKHIKHLIEELASRFGWVIHGM